MTPPVGEVYFFLVLKILLASSVVDPIRFKSIRPGETFSALRGRSSALGLALGLPADRRLVTAPS